ncbi:MAG: DmsE family decaheme c-type cytochrome [Ignavibacteriae bacterium]|nr:DmsE family decaheme c-type cytochrome [Ignavibacteriota bacterium]
MKKPAIILLSACVVGLSVAIPLLAQRGTDKVDWAKLNPAFKGATFVKDKEACLTCHEESGKKYLTTTHGRLFGKSMAGADCETCHGPRSKHVEEPDSSLALSVEQYSEVCMQCHQDGNRMYWQTSLHKTTGVGCVSCHTVMENRSHTALLAKANQFAVCSSCHEDVKAMLSRTSHHPIQEGKVDCSSCHNMHGAPGRAMLAKGEVNETCFGCHQEKRGPFLWEHPPALEDCLTCHQPHGSNNRSLLVTQNASLCVTCHQYGGHVNQFRYNRVSTPYGNGCVNCHMMVHGSNHPSGARFTR